MIKPSVNKARKRDRSCYSKVKVVTLAKFDYKCYVGRNIRFRLKLCKFNDKRRSRQS